MCECGDWCTLGCTAEAELDSVDLGSPEMDGLDFELGEACELGDTDCESCQ